MNRKNSYTRDITIDLNYKDLHHIYIDKNYKKEDFIEIVPLGGFYKKSLEGLEEIDTAGFMNHNIGGDCWFYEGNKCWILKGDEAKDSKDRYFSSNNDGNYFHLTVSDFYKIFIGSTNLNKRLREIFCDYQIFVEEEEWKMNQINILKNNTVAVNKGKLENYPYLERLLRSNMNILRYINMLGVDRIMGLNESNNGRAIITMPANYLTNTINNESDIIGSKENQPKVSKSLNLYCLLGLMEKVHESTLPNHMLEKERKRVADNNYGTNNIRSCYVINPLNEIILKNAENIAEHCRKHGLSYSNISYKKVLTIFGSEVALNIYKDTLSNSIKSQNARKKNKIKEKKLYEEIDRIEIPF